MFYLRIFLEKQTLLLIFYLACKPPNFTLQIKLTDNVPIRDIEIDIEGKAQDVSLSNISDITPFSAAVQPVVNEKFINELKAHGLWAIFSKTT